MFLAICLIGASLSVMTIGQGFYLIGRAIFEIIRGV